MRRREIVIAKGLATFLPPLQRVLRPSGAGTSADYCYSVFMRHFVRARAVHAWDVPVPRSVAELGPGDSVGAGVAALLAGAERYAGLDVVAHADFQRLLPILDDLLQLFEARAPIPELREVEPSLDRYDFPRELLPDDWLHRALAPERVDRVRAALSGGGEMIRYRAPWDDAEVVEPGSVDFLFSQAVLEHVVDLDATHRAAARWLSPGGLVSHQVDLRSHGLHEAWNGHWTYGPLAWRLIRGGRPYMLNRAPYSEHAAALRRAGFEIVNEERQTPSQAGVGRADLASRFRGLDDEDLGSSGAFIQARLTSNETSAPPA